jgi:Protein of unknown function (DUF1592)/Protein of unknown function (DUF1588)/Protein of unknown function (DUF1585)/Protein of unknown function (DUF1587)/Protein of unknown function (DUF1595)/Planctomycete cytochrome C
MRIRAWVPALTAVAIAGLAVLLALGGHLLSDGLPGSSGNDRELGAKQRVLLDEYCVDCHDRELKTAGLALDTLPFSRIAADAPVWERVIRKLETGMMPPAGEPRPERAELDALAAGIAGEIDRAAARAPDPGAPVLHRLNRNEYANAIRDLLALDVDVAALLPEDDTSEGFDNIADVLGSSPSLIQGYLSAALKLSRLAVGDRTMVASRTVYRVPAGLAQDRHIAGLPLGTRGGLLFEHYFALDGEYEFRVSGGARGFLGVQSVDPPPEIVVIVDGRPTPVEDARNFRLSLGAGPHEIGVALVDRVRSAGVDDIFSVYSVRGSIQNVAITGPFTPTGVGSPPGRRRLFTCYPQGESEADACAREILSQAASSAFREPRAALAPRTDTDPLAPIMQFYDRGRAEGDFETGIQQALARILVDPRFLFRFEAEPEDLAPGAIYRISGVELASRLSFFLWSSIPDAELLEVAAEGRLFEPAVLAEQVQRMLADPKAGAFVENFAGQWLHLRELGGVAPESPYFDENLRRAFKEETELLLASVLREDRPVLDLLDADYTYLNERLAEHYGIEGVHGSYMRRVALPADSPRRGLLGQGSILTVTSVANRTSPVVRGSWLLENLLGAPVPLPPPGVETDLIEKVDPGNATSLRERLELHRRDPVCASCHSIMDPIGLALENFDLIGGWRTEDTGQPIDASGVLVDGTALNGPSDLREVLVDHSDSFVTVATEKLLTYALGRGVEYYDMPAIRTIVRDSAADDYRFSSLIYGIVTSVPFQMRTKSARDEQTR